MTIGIIGGGMIGQVHIRNLLRDSRVRIKWICTLPLESAKELQHIFNIPRVTINYEEVLEDSEVEAIVIATPPAQHAHQVIDALRAKKHILIEKPMALTVNDVRHIAEEAKLHPNQIVLSAAARHSRAQPKYHFIRTLLEQGEIGDIYHIDHRVLRTARRYGIEYNPLATWSLSRATAGGGPMIDWGVYDLSFHIGLLSENIKLKQIHSYTYNGLDDAHTIFPQFDVEEHGIALLGFSDNISYSYQRSTNTHIEAPNETIIHGTHGALQFDYLSWGSPKVKLSKAPLHRDTNSTMKEFFVPIDKDHDDHVAIITHFVDCLMGKAKPLLTPAQELLHFEIISNILSPPPHTLRR